MAEHRASLSWKRGEREFTYDSYSRDHEWSFEGGIKVAASAAPGYLGSAERVNPEEAFVASLSSCHMLTFLAVAAKRRFVVDAYDDEAVGHLEKNEEGKLAVTRVILHPKVIFGGEKRPTEEQIATMHKQSHEQCFIASSVKTAVSVEPSPITEST